MSYGRDEVARILRMLGCTFVNGTDDGCGFQWQIGNPAKHEYFDCNVPAAALVKEPADGGLIKTAVVKPEEFLKQLLSKC
jgi:hypothetical protein